jgi:hypothetical protein
LRELDNVTRPDPGSIILSADSRNDGTVTAERSGRASAFVTVRPAVLAQFQDTVHPADIWAVDTDITVAAAHRNVIRFRGVVRLYLAADDHIHL